MKRASYRMAVRWIALNDDLGSQDACNEQVVAGYISTLLVSDLFDVNPLKVAGDVIKQRRTLVPVPEDENQGPRLPKSGGALEASDIFEKTRRGKS